jgi:hypothetical protein
MSTNCSAPKNSGSMPALGSRIVCEVSQFWQYEQWKSQPSIPKVSVVEPGRKWKNGFFSVGSA